MPGNSWLPLDDLLAELWTFDIEPRDLPTLFRIFECYPEEDGAGVLWSIVHGIEGLSFDYRAALMASMNRQPSFMGDIMLKRLHKSQE